MNKIAFKGGLLIDGTGAAPVKDSLYLWMEIRLLMPVWGKRWMYRRDTAV